MNYSFLQIGSSEYNNMSRDAAEVTKGIVINPIQELLDNIPNKPNILKVKKAVSWKDNQPTIDVFYLAKHDLEECGIPDWFEQIVSYETLNIHHKWAVHAMHFMQKRTISASSLEQIFQENNIERLGILSILIVEKSVDILLNSVSFIGGRQYKIPTISFNKDTVSEDKVQEVITAYQNIGYNLKETNGNTVVLQHNDYPG